MPATMTAEATLSREFLDIRGRMLDIAAALDRISNAPDANALRGDARLRLINQAANVLAENRSDRARQVQMIFSLPYEESWQTESGE